VPPDKWVTLRNIALEMQKHLTIQERTTYRSLEDVVGCKWSAAVVAAISRGVERPGALERFIPGISTKVLNERLRKLLNYGLITRTEHAGLPARVEYKLTPTGKKLALIIEELRKLNALCEEQAQQTSTALSQSIEKASDQSISRGCGPAGGGKRRSNSESCEAVK